MRIPREYLATIGARGGRKSRRALSPEVARSMVRVREARRAYRRFHAACFATFASDRVIVAADIPWVVEQLSQSDREDARAAAARLMPIRVVQFPRIARPTRYDITARVLPLRSAEAAVAIVPGTVAERRAVLREMSEAMWRLSKRDLPEYTRETMPISIRPLREPDKRG